MRVVLAGGGTGGHVIPALAIAQQLKKAYAAELLFIGTPRGMENRLVPAAGFELRLVQVGALKNVSLATRLKTSLDLPRALWNSRRMLHEFQPDVVIGVGGYASGPAMAAAIVRGVPTIAFEPNVVPGFANRMVARWVSAAAVHFEETCKYFPNCHVTGVSGAAGVFSDSPKAPGSQPTLFVFAARPAPSTTPWWESRPVQCQRALMLHIVHQTGERDFGPRAVAYAQSNISGEVHKFIDDMPAMFARADLLCARSGASTVGEITAAGKPAIFVPFPRAADDHQNVNARALERAGAAVVVEESNLEAAYLVDTITALIDDAPRLQRMSEAARSLAHPKAVEEIAAIVEELIDSRVRI
jgi:UDP-N-acetylglucosamine--N-acetylmuramyl-(pentapeptide) pyrophosphoryl-undecaprenol N-acetylglucosamine transferase